MKLVAQRRWFTVATALCMVVGATAVGLALAHSDHPAPPLAHEPFAYQPFTGVPFGSATTAVQAPAPPWPNPPVVSLPAPPHAAPSLVHRCDRPSSAVVAYAAAPPAPLQPTPGTDVHRSRLVDPHLPDPIPSIPETVGWLVPGVA